MWARIENDVVVEVTNTNPVGRFHQALNWQGCPWNTEIGWQFSAGDFKPPPGPSVKAQADSERLWRDVTLTGTEWLVARHRDETDMGLAPTLTFEQVAELMTYRQALRQWPLVIDFPDPRFRPPPPTWLALQAE